MNMNHTKRIIGATIVIGMVLAGAVGVFAFSLGKYEKIKANGDAISIPVARVADGKAHFYRFEDGGKAIDFFVAKASDGSYRTAFDTCDVCYKEKKGYEKDGDAMVCKNCNKRFAINRIGPHEVGGCNPSYLPHRLSGGSISVTVADLKAGLRFF